MQCMFSIIITRGLNQSNSQKSIYTFVVLVKSKGFHYILYLIKIQLIHVLLGNCLWYNTVFRKALIYIIRIFEH